MFGESQKGEKASEGGEEEKATTNCIHTYEPNWNGLGTERTPAKPSPAQPSQAFMYGACGYPSVCLAC